MEKKKEIKSPKVFKLSLLPQWLQMAIAEMWEKNGTKPENVDVLYTYFEGIYTARAISQDIFQHECVHFIRQGSGENENLAKEWWLRYVTDPEFRYQEELMAYREQYQFILKKTNKAVAFEIVKNRLAYDLSGPMYGFLCSYQKALSDIIKQ